MQSLHVKEVQKARNQFACVIHVEYGSVLDDRLLNIVRLPEPPQLLSNWLDLQGSSLGNKLVTIVGDDSRMPELVSLLARIEGLGLSLVPMDGASNYTDDALLEHVTALFQPVGGQGSRTDDTDADTNEALAGTPPGTNYEARLRPYLHPEYRLSDEGYGEWLARLQQDPHTRED